MVESRLDETLAAQHVLLEPVRRDLGDLVVLVGAGGHGKDVIQFLEGALLRLGQPQKDHDEGDGVEAGVEAERALGGHGLEHAREGQGQDRGPEVVGRHGPGHAYLTVGQGENLGRVGKGDGALAGRVEDVEKIDEQRDEAQMGVAALGDPETEPRRQERPAHVGESEEEQRPPSERVDRPHGRPGEEEVYQTEPPGGQETAGVAGAGVRKHRRRVKGDDVDAAHLLRNHDNAGGLSGTADTWNGEELHEAGEEVAVGGGGRFFNQNVFLDQLRVDVVEIACRLERAPSETEKRPVRFGVHSLFHEPTRRLLYDVLD